MGIKAILISMIITLGTYAVAEIAPGYNSYVTLYHRLPSGDLQTEYLGYLCDFLPSLNVGASYFNEHLRIHTQA